MSMQIREQPDGLLTLRTNCKVDVEIIFHFGRGVLDLNQAVTDYLLFTYMNNIEHTVCLLILAIHLLFTHLEYLYL